MTMVDPEVIETGVDVADGEYEGFDTPWIGMVRENVAALVAATFPAKPPTSWFANPRLTGPTPLTIDNDGRVYGHIATWRTSHIGMAGGVKPPRSRSRYAFFATGVLETQEGDKLNVGQITLSGGHAPLDASVAQAVAHYDDTNSAVMDVAIGEDDTGVWVAGGLRPDIDEIKLRSIRASSVSGDWRPINGNLELVAVCAVNVPGFPIPRARVASGQPIALVAAGTETLAYVALLDRAGIDIRKGIEAGMGDFADRIARLEQTAIVSASEQRRQTQEAVKIAREAKRLSAAGEPDTATALRARVHPELAKAEELRARVHATMEDRLDSLELDFADDPDSASVVWEDLTPIEASLATLRMRVHLPTG
jgi:hypothetical protein